MEDSIEIVPLKEAVRMRPALYIGNDGVIGIFKGLILDCIEFCKTDEITFEILVSGENDFTFGLATRHHIHPFLQQFTDRIEATTAYTPMLLYAIAENLRIVAQEDSRYEITFSFDKTVMPDITVDELSLVGKLLLVALVNRNCEIIIVDKRKKYAVQNYLHFPQGVLYVFDRASKEALGRPSFKMTFDGNVDSNKYQIGVAYRTDWHPSPEIYALANHVQTTCGGSLVEGVLDGLIIACKRYVKENNLTTFKIRRKKIFNGLILVCAVRGEKFKYLGSFNEALNDEIVRKQAKKIVAESVLEIFRNHKAVADKFLWRFDTSQFMSGMY